MTVDEKAGLFFQTHDHHGRGRGLAEGDPIFGLPSTSEYVVGRADDPLQPARRGAERAARSRRWHNKLQGLAASTRLGIPVTISTDPRHSFSDNPGAAILAGRSRSGPRPLGLAAIARRRTRRALRRHRPPGVHRRSASASLCTRRSTSRPSRAGRGRCRRSVRTPTSPASWVPRTSAGSRATRSVPGSVSTMTKHFPGGGPQKDGEDPHFDVRPRAGLPGRPVRAAPRSPSRRPSLPAGARSCRTTACRSAPSTKRSASASTGRCSPACSASASASTASYAPTGVSSPIPRSSASRSPPARGASSTSRRAERMAKILDAGADQFGGESMPRAARRARRAGTVTRGAPGRLGAPPAAREVPARPVRESLRRRRSRGRDRRLAEFRAAGDAAQRASITVLTNAWTDAGVPALPLARGANLYVEGIVRRGRARVRRRSSPLPPRRMSRSCGCRRRTSSARRRSRTSSTPGPWSSRPM